MEKLGIRPERLQLEWISAAEGQKFARVMKELDGMVREVTADEIRATQEILERKAAPRPAPTTNNQRPTTNKDHA
jgi:heterodisulfide reductase subunit A2